MPCHVQVFLTGRLLQKMPPGLALAILPLTAATLLAVLAVQPTPVMVAAAEVLRKVQLAWQIWAALMVHAIDCSVVLSDLGFRVASGSQLLLLPQLIAYGVARPAREILFTVVSSEDKYRAKVCRPRQCSKHLSWGYIRIPPAADVKSTGKPIEALKYVRPVTTGCKRPPPATSQRLKLQGVSALLL